MTCTFFSQLLRTVAWNSFSGFWILTSMLKFHLQVLHFFPMVFLSLTVKNVMTFTVIFLLVTSYLLLSRSPFFFCWLDLVHFFHCYLSSLSVLHTAHCSHLKVLLVLPESKFVGLGVLCAFWFLDQAGGCMLSVSTDNWKNTVLRSDLRSYLSYCFTSVKQTSFQWSPQVPNT